MNKDKPKFKRLFWDLEVSPDLGFFWNPGPKVNISYEAIVKERAIICVAFKFEGDKKVSYIKWNKGDDKKLVEQFSKILISADESVAHNGDNFDIRWFRGRCLLHETPLPPDLVTIDTLKLARKLFRLNSNRLDYLGQFLGLGKKVHTEYDLWKDIVLKNDSPSMNKMVKYCQGDVLLLEKVFNKLKSYAPAKSHRGVFCGKSSHSCPECGGVHGISNGTRITATGVKKQRLHCQDCGKYWTITIPKREDIGI